MNIYEKAICDMTKSLNVITMYRERWKQQIKECSEEEKPLTPMRKFYTPVDSLVFRTTAFNHLDNLEKIFGISNDANPLLDRYRGHIWNALNISHEDPQTERKKVRKQLAKALKEGKRINNFLQNTTYNFS